MLPTRRRFSTLRIIAALVWSCGVQASFARHGATAAGDARRAAQGEDRGSDPRRRRAALPRQRLRGDDDRGPLQHSRRRGRLDHAHFGDKEGVYAALIDRALDLDRSYSESGFEQGHSPLERLVGLGEGYLQGFAREHPGYFRLFRFPPPRPARRR